MIKRIALTAAAALVVAGLAPTSAGASRNMLVGIFDEPQTFANTEWAFTQYRLARIKVLRVNLYWGGPTGVARRRPANALDPADPAYAWARFDDLVRRAAKARIKMVFSIYATPGWANGGKAINRAPRKMLELRNFAFAAAKRYSGTYTPPQVGTQRKQEVVLPLPAVRHWLAWNEPNNPVFLQPQFVRRGKSYRLNSPRLYAQICNAIFNGVHMTHLAGEKVACGVTAPTGNNTARQSRPSVSPLFFLRGMKRAGARFDAYAHHPYYGHRSETPNTRPKGPSAVRLGNINDLIRELTRLYGPKRVWLTEYGYQTRPPDRAFGVSFRTQARYVAMSFAKARRNPRIDMMLWFLLKDDRRIGKGWQSGFYTVGGRQKPSWRAFRNLRK